MQRTGGRDGGACSSTFGGPRMQPPYTLGSWAPNFPLGTFDQGLSLADDLSDLACSQLRWEKQNYMAGMYDVLLVRVKVRAASTK